MTPAVTPASLKRAAIDAANHRCVKTHSTSLSARIKKYPFNKAAQVQLVSFDGRVEITGSSRFAFLNIDPLLLSADSATKPTLKELRVLTLLQIDRLTDVLYNYGYAGPIYSNETRDCYDPRNAILFLDSDGKSIAFIEICFECLSTRQSDEKVLTGEMCDSKLDMLRALFREAGIKYGTGK